MWWQLATVFSDGSNGNVKSVDGKKRTLVASDETGAISDATSSPTNKSAVNKKLAERPTRTALPKQQFSPDAPPGKQSKPQPTKGSGGGKRPREDEDEDDDEHLPADDDQINNKRRSLVKNNGMKGARNLIPAKNINNNLRKGGHKRKGSGVEPPAKRPKPAPESVQEETTYVLPANLSEWCKLFDMVDSQIGSGSLKKSDVPEAKQLLKHQDDINVLPLEEQVRVFHRLCNLANIQVD